MDNEGEWGSSIHYDYGFRIYNQMIAKFLSVDPLSPEYPWYTPYQFAGNEPIANIDRDGLEPWNVTGSDRGQSTVNGPYRSQEDAQQAYSQNEVFGTYTLSEVSVKASRLLASSSSSTSSPSVGQYVRGGAFMSGFNGALRLNYAANSMLTYPLYHSKDMHKLGVVSRYIGKEITRVNLAGGRVHMDFIDPMKYKVGTRFYHTNPIINIAGAAGVAYGSYHVYQTGNTLLSLESSQDRAVFIGLETGRNLVALHQMRAASIGYESVAIRTGLNLAPRSINIGGALTYGTFRAAAGSTVFSFVAMGLVDYSELLANPQLEQAYRQAEKKNPYRGFVIGAHDSFGFSQWLWGTNKN